MTFVVYHYKTDRPVSQYEEYAEAVDSMHLHNSQWGYKKVSRSWSDGIEQELCIDSKGTKEVGPFRLCHLRYWNKLHKI